MWHATQEVPGFERCASHLTRGAVGALELCAGHPSIETPSTIGGPFGRGCLRRSLSSQHLPAATGATDPSHPQILEPPTATSHPGRYRRARLQSWATRLQTTHDSSPRRQSGAEGLPEFYSITAEVANQISLFHDHGTYSAGIKKRPPAGTDPSVLWEPSLASLLLNGPSRVPPFQP